MRYFFVLISLPFLYGCNKVKLHNDKAAQLSGRYDVKTYVLNGDTLLGNGIDKFGFEEFYVFVGRKSTDSLLVIGQSKMKDANSVPGATRNAGFKETGNTYSISYAHWETQNYQTELSGPVFRERTELTGGGILVIPQNYSVKKSRRPGS